MKLAVGVLVAAVLSACGGGGSGGDAPEGPRARFTNQVTFGDSLSDVGSYNVGAVNALGGGRFTINGPGNAMWTEVLAASLKLPAPCAAQTGLDGDATQGFAVPVTNNAGCFNYAQGGARISAPVGPNNKLTGSPLGHLTVPVSAQLAAHLSKAGGKFGSQDLVTVMVGANDAFMLLAGLQAGATAAGQAAGAAEGAKVGAQVFASTLIPLLAAGATDPAAAAQAIGLAMATEAARPGKTDQSLVGAAVMAAATQPGNQAVGQASVYGPMVQQAQAAAQAAGASAGAKAGAAAGSAYAQENGPKLIVQMGAAATELANLIKTQIIAKGANYVVVNNLPHLAGTPSSRAADPAILPLIIAMVGRFNGDLKTALAGTEDKVLYVDIYAASYDQVTNPAKWGLSNVTTPACGPNKISTSSLFCNATNVIAGDVSKYMYADEVHPTPYTHGLIGKLVADQLVIKGWK